MTLLRMSLIGAVLILAVAAVRALALRKLPANTFLVLWGVVLLRLLVPFALPGPLPAPGITSGTAYVDSGGYYRPVPGGVADPGEGGGVTAPAPVRRTLPVPALLWAAGALALTAYLLAGGVRVRRQLRVAVPASGETVEGFLAEHPLRRRVRVLVSDRVPGPMTLGLLRPVIVLPLSMDWERDPRLLYVLEHEWQHIRRLDALWKLLMACALCLHWFNPTVWLMAVLGGRDLELTCDRAATRRGDRRAYALALVELEEEKSGLAGAGSGFSKNAIEERIAALVRHKKTTAAAVAVALLLVAGVAAAAVFSAPDRGEETGEGLEYGVFSSLAATDESRKLALIRDLERRLAETLEAVEGVARAAVQTTVEDGEATAVQVTLRLQRGVALSAEQAQAVERLVAGCYSGIYAKDITILTTDNMLTPEVLVGEEQAFFDDAFPKGWEEDTLERFNKRLSKWIHGYDNPMYGGIGFYNSATPEEYWALTYSGIELRSAPGQASWECGAGGVRPNPDPKGARHQSAYLQESWRYTISWAVDDPSAVTVAERDQVLNTFQVQLQALQDRLTAQEDWENGRETAIMVHQLAEEVSTEHVKLRVEHSVSGTSSAGTPWYPMLTEQYLQALKAGEHQAHTDALTVLSEYTRSKWSPGAVQISPQWERGGERSYQCTLPDGTVQEILLKRFLIPGCPAIWAVS